MTQPTQTAPAPTPWSPGAWFGAQLGSTCWLAIAGLLLIPTSLAVSLGLLLIFGATNVAGRTLWQRRAHLTPRRAYRGLILLVGAGSLAGVVLLDVSGRWYEASVGWTLPPLAMYVLLAVLIPFLLVVVDRAHRGADA